MASSCGACDDAMLFMLKERVELKDENPLLCCSDVEQLLAYFFPRRDVGAEEVIRQMKVRHRKRQQSIDYTYEKKRVSSCEETWGM